MTLPRSLTITTQEKALEGLGSEDVALAPDGPPLKLGAAMSFILPELAGEDVEAAFEALCSTVVHSDLIARGVVIFCSQEMARELAMRIDPTSWEAATDIGRYGGVITFVDGHFSQCVRAFVSPTRRATLTATTTPTT